MLIYLAAINSDEDKTKFELIYRQYRNLMYYVANQILHNICDAEDVVHQAFLKIIEILDTISEIKSHKTRSLIVTITERKAIDLYRSKSRAAVLPLDETYIGSVAANEIEHMAESDAIAAAIAALPARYREVLLLRYDNGFSYSEIAKALDMTEAAVRKTVQRAKEALQRTLQIQEEDTDEDNR